MYRGEKQMPHSGNQEIKSESEQEPTFDVTEFMSYCEANRSADRLVEALIRKGNVYGELGDEDEVVSELEEQELVAIAVLNTEEGNDLIEGFICQERGVDSYTELDKEVMRSDEVRMRDQVGKLVFRGVNEKHSDLMGGKGMIKQKEDRFYVVK